MVIEMHKNLCTIDRFLCIFRLSRWIVETEFLSWYHFFEQYREYFRETKSRPLKNKWHKVC